MSQNLLAFIFFFLCRRQPPRSPPFPTRRSSDLDVAGEQRGAAGRGVVHPGGLPGHVDALLRPHRPAGRDRKSTRLNSSHANISYAVFCLKKKKRKESKTLQQNTKKKTKSVTAVA